MNTALEKATKTEPSLQSGRRKGMKTHSCFVPKLDSRQLWARLHLMPLPQSKLKGLHYRAHALWRPGLLWLRPSTWFPLHHRMSLVGACSFNTLFPKQLFVERWPQV